MENIGVFARRLIAVHVDGLDTGECELREENGCRCGGVGGGVSRMMRWESSGII